MDVAGRTSARKMRHSIGSGASPTRKSAICQKAGKWSLGEACNLASPFRLIDGGTIVFFRVVMLLLRPVLLDKQPRSPLSVARAFLPVWDVRHREHREGPGSLTLRDPERAVAALRVLIRAQKYRQTNKMQVCLNRMQASLRST